MKRACVAILFQFLTTFLFAQSQPPLTSQSRQSSSRPGVESQQTSSVSSPQLFGLRNRPRRVPFSPWNDYSAAWPGNVERAGLSSGESASNSIFLEAPSYGSGGAFAESVAVADVNGDGKVDLVVANGDDVSVLLGNGDGKFQPAVGYGSGGTDVVVADVNGDSKLDLLVATQCADSNCTTGSVAVLLGNGDGTFQPAVTYVSGGFSNFAVAVADVNGDGKPDLLTSNYCVDNNCSTDGSVGVLLGNGDGTFQPVVTYDSGGLFTVAVVVRDVNEDGERDLLVANNCADSNCTTGSVGVLLGNGDGTFRAAVTYGSGGYAADSIATADVNGDGKPDLIVANSICIPLGVCGSGSVGVLLGNGNGTFQPVVTYDSGGFSAASVAVGDFDGDGNPDLFVANTCTADGPFECITGSVGVLTGNGNGTFRTAVSYNSGGNGAASVSTADVNADGAQDLIVANACGDGGGYGCTMGSLGVLLNNSNRTFYAARNYGSGGYEADSVAVADLNGDGKLDLVVANLSADPGGPEGTIGVLLGNGDGTLQGAVIYGSGGIAESIAVADVNLDGNLDLVVADQCESSNCTSGSIGLLLGNGDGTFQAAISYRLEGFPNSVAVADVNGDGKPDVLTASNSTVEVLLGNGDGTFQPPSENITSLDGESLAVGEVNGDGKLDLIVANHGDGTPNSGSVSVLLGNGDGTFQPAVNYSSDAIYTDAVVIGDMNGDGKVDIVVASQFTNAPPLAGVVGILLGNGDGTFRTPVSTSTPTPLEGVRSLALADFDADGNLDVAVGAGNTLLLGNGDGTFQPSMVLGAGGPGINVGDFNRDGRPDIAVGAVTILLNIFRFSTATSVTSSVNPSSFGQSVTFTAAVTSHGKGTPTGAVSFFDGMTNIGNSHVDGSGLAKFTISSLVVGTHGITAFYRGDANFALSKASLIQKVLVDATPPSIHLSADPTDLWPPNGEMVPVTVSDAMLDSGSGVDPSSARYSVIDDYGLVQPSGSIAVDSGGKFSFTILLDASRAGNDKDGRHYTITVSAKDNAGNLGSNSTVVTVPHDQGH